ncbi:MAG: hypothetical protein M1324_01790 [Patescibacteria group bacterium]|nr:hypothetical protein [Patescibacteria group bacterium]
MQRRILIIGSSLLYSKIFGSPSKNVRVGIIGNKERLLHLSRRMPNVYGTIVISGWLNKDSIEEDIVVNILHDPHCPIIGTDDRESVREHLMRLGCHAVYSKLEIAEQSYSILELWCNLLKRSQKEPGELCRIVTEKAAQLQITFVGALDTISDEIEEDKITRDNEIILAASLRSGYNEYS